tara:strand:+ start:271 stop:708 length:438 start_codon:yes stop_codon:yes gene_type:complete
MNYKKTYFVYTGWSLIKGEEKCVTLGLSSHGWRREYNKVMNINLVLPCTCLAHARAVERAGHDFLNHHKTPKAFVRWSPKELSKSPNRSWDWWITNTGLTPSHTANVVERMRNVQTFWKPENHRLYMARVKKGIPNKLRGVKYGK